MYNSLGVYYSNFDIGCIIVGVISLLAIYIYLKATKVMWYGIQWNNVRRRFCQMLCKLFNK